MSDTDKPPSTTSTPKIRKVKPGLAGRLLPRMFSGVRAEPHSPEALVEQLREAQSKGLLDGDALRMVEGVLEVGEMQVREVMIPRAQMVAVERDAPRDDLLNIILECGHSRFPVVGESRDEVVGILLAKDLLRFAAEHDEEPFNIREVLRPAIFIPESKRLNVLLREFRANRNHMAIVVDEYGGVAGLVTIEDVLEQIVGEIDDEHDSYEGPHIFRHDEQRYSVKALTPIEDFDEYFGSELDADDEEMDTVGGLVMRAFGYMPKRDEAVEIAGFRFKVLRADSRRIYLLQVSPLAEESA